jgi:hypothetical protein
LRERTMLLPDLLLVKTRGRSWLGMKAPIYCL